MSKPLDEDSVKLIEFIKSLPEGSILPWACDHMGELHPWCGGWADIRLSNEILDKLETRWNWTIELPWAKEIGDNLFGDEDDEEPEFDYIWNFAAEPDLMRYIVCNSYDEAADIAFPRGKALGVEQVAIIQDALDEDPENILVGSGAWSDQCLSDILNLWCAVHAGRPDIKFEWTPALGESQELQKAQAVLQRILDGEEETYMIKPGEKEGGEGYTIKVTGEIMDAMLQAELDQD